MLIPFSSRLVPSAPASSGWRLGLPEIAGPGFRLREPRLADGDALARAFDADAAATMGVEAPGTSDQWVHVVASARADRAARHTACYLVERDGSADVCGLVLLQRVARGSRVTTASFVFPETERQTALPALTLACVFAFAFQTVGVGRVEGRVACQRDLDLVRRLGAVEEGVLRGAMPSADGFADQMLWSLLGSDWDVAGAGTHADTVPGSIDAAAPVTDVHEEYREPAAWTRGLPALRGSLTTLREIELLDAPVLFNALDPSDVAISIEPAPRTRDDLRRYIAWVQWQRALGRAAGFAIVPRGTRHAAGLIQVRRSDLAGAVAEWGIVLAPRYRGTGVAAEASRLMVAFAFDTLGVHRLEARASGVDPRSTGLFRKIGAVREARLRRSFVLGSDVLDDDLWAILKSDWRGGGSIA